MFAGNNAKFTTFLIKNKEAFEHYFKQTKCNQDIDKLYTLKDVYDQIALIVDSVSRKIQVAIAIIASETFKLSS